LALQELAYHGPVSLVCLIELGLSFIQRIGNPTVWQWCPHDLDEPAPLITGRQFFLIHPADPNFAVKHDVVIILPVSGTRPSMTS
jgi:hypothetical protein